MKIRIVSDSTCDLPEKLVTQYRISIVPCYINFGSESLLDNVEISRADFYRRISSKTEFPKTSAPSIGLFTKVYNRLADEGAKEIISIHVRPGLSSMANVARLAAQSLDRVRIHVIEVGQLAITLGYLVMQAAKAAAEGKSSREIIEMVKEKDQRAYLFAALNTLEYLKRGGRVPALIASLADFLNIKPVVLLRLGNVSLADRVRTTSKQVEYLLKLARRQGPLEWIGVAHTNAADRAVQLADAIKSIFHYTKEIWIEEVTPVLGVHVGPGALGVACIKSVTE